MCRSAAEGGQRCFGDALKALTKARETDALRYTEFRAAEEACVADSALTGKFHVAGSKLRAAQDNVLRRQIELASTVEGEAHFRALPSQFNYERILARGLEMRERNEAIRQAGRNLTVDGTMVTQETVDAAQAVTDQANARLKRLADSRPISLNDRLARNGASIEVMNAENAAANTQAAYDSTPEGQERLTRLEGPPGSTSAGYLHPTTLRRSAAARYASAAERAMPTGRPTAELEAKRTRVRAEMDQAAAQDRISGSPASKHALFEATEAYRAADQGYLRSLPRPRAGTDFNNRVMWEMLDGGQDCDRKTAWRSVELAARDHDNAQVRSGQMTGVAFNARAAARGRVRQDVLDAEGNAERDGSSGRPVRQRTASIYS